MRTQVSTFDQVTSTRHEQFDRLAFGDFLASLQRQGFTVGVDQHLRLQQLLARVGGQCAPRELRTLLCPLFATSQKQQAAFYRAFDEHFALFFQTEATAPDDQVPAKSPEPEQESAPPAEIPPPTKRTKLIVTALTVAVILLVCSAIWLWRNDRFRKAVGIQQIELPPAPVFVPPKPPTPTPQAAPPKVVELPPPQPTPTPAPRSDFVLDHPWALRLPALLLPLAAVLLYLLWRWRRRRLVIERAADRKPPFTWPVSVTDAPELNLDRSQLFYQAVRGLRRRQLGEYHRLDMPRTISATIAARGYPSFRYQAVSRVPEYLVLIDRASRLDHQARLFDQLAQSLEREGLFVVRYFYNGDPRICRSVSTPTVREGLASETEALADARATDTRITSTEELYLTELHRKYPAHRLVLMGDGARLLDSETGEFNEWALQLTEWPERAVLTPVSLPAWRWREHVLGEYFTLLPATLAGLAELAERYDLPLVDESLLRDETATAPAPPDTEYGVTVEELRNYLGLEAFQWLCACAVYPEMQWELTLRLGELAMADPIREATLWRLLRLPWFRQGAIPDEVRLALVQSLDPAREQAVREFIIRMLGQSVTDALENGPNEAASYAEDERRLEIAVQEAWLARNNRRDLKQALEKIKHLPPEEVRRDYTLLRLLADRPTSPLALVLPPQFRRLFYPDGVSFFGVKWQAALALALLAALLAWGAVESLIQYKHYHRPISEPPAFDQPTPPTVPPMPSELPAQSPTPTVTPKAAPSVSPVNQTLAIVKEGQTDPATAQTTPPANAIRLELAPIPGGEFLMGSPETEADRTDDEGPQHRVTVKPFYMSKYEITQAQWRAIAGRPKVERDLNPDPSNFKGDDLPVDSVSWNDAVEFCKRLSALTGETYRLPTEAEWEYACRADTVTPFFFGSSLSSDQANFDGNYPYGGAPKGVYRERTTRVGNFSPNKFGLYDMHGNVWEWVQDKWHANYNGAPEDGSDWFSGGDSSFRVLRGGSWVNYGDDCRSAYRVRVAPGDFINSIGFRVVSARTP